MDKANAMLIEALVQNNMSMSLAIVDLQVVKPSFNYPLSVNRVYSLPSPFSYVGGVWNAIKFYRILKSISKNHQILIVQLPFVGFLSLLFIRKPTVYHVCANVLTAAANPVKYRGYRRVASGIFAWIINQVHNYLFSRKEVQVIVNGKELFELYRKYTPQIAISSSLNSADILNDRQLPISERPIRLVFVGRPSLEKGFDTLIAALSEPTFDFRLTVVGFTQGDFQQMLPSVFESSKHIHKWINFKGFLGWMSGLRDVLQVSDIALIPSRSEGTPRVILECMSQGVAVIASRVGGIPTIVEDSENGLLVEPGSYDELRDKIMVLKRDYALRNRLVLGGFRTARGNTIERFVGHFNSAIENFRF